MKEIPPLIKEKIDKLTDELKKVYELAEQSWEGCDGCDENDKHFFIKGFQACYYRTKPDELSDEEIGKQSKYWNETTNPEMWTFKLAWRAGAKWYREQLKK